MLFTVIERFRDRRAREVCHRSQEEGRLMLHGLKYIGSRVEVNVKRCLQLMECDDARLFQQ